VLERLAAAVHCGSQIPEGRGRRGGGGAGQGRACSRF
jgi:hypothetical protein